MTRYITTYVPQNAIPYNGKSRKSINEQTRGERGETEDRGKDGDFAYNGQMLSPATTQPRPIPAPTCDGKWSKHAHTKPLFPGLSEQGGVAALIATTVYRGHPAHWLMISTAVNFELVALANIQQSLSLPSSTRKKFYSQRPSGNAVVKYAFPPPPPPPVNAFIFIAHRVQNSRFSAFRPR